DGSTADTEKVLKPYGDRLRHFREANRGPSAARNLGVCHATAGWISIQDSDDICAPHHLKPLYGFVEKNPDCRMVFANRSDLDDAGAKGNTIIPRQKAKRLVEKGVELTDLFSTSIVRLQADLLSKKAFFAVGGLDENLLIAMDMDLT